MHIIKTVDEANRKTSIALKMSKTVAVSPDVNLSLASSLRIENIRRIVKITTRRVSPHHTRGSVLLLDLAELLSGLVSQVFRSFQMLKMVELLSGLVVLGLVSQVSRLFQMLKMVVSGLPMVALLCTRVTPHIRCWIKISTTI